MNFQVQVPDPLSQQDQNSDTQNPNSLDWGWHNNHMGYHHHPTPNLYYSKRSWCPKSRIPIRIIVFDELDFIILVSQGLTLTTACLVTLNILCLTINFAKLYS